jgi:catechol 2,3-dioxygenase-like lactoylglutathione lyase family enzyme
MEKRLGTVTLGVRDLARGRGFYEDGLGWTRDGGESDIAFYQLAGTVLGLYEWPKLAKDAGVEDAGNGFRAVTLAYCARTQDEVRIVMHRAAQAGAKILVRPRNTFWGGYSGYFADLDGHMWEIQWNPHLQITERGEHLMLPRAS